MKYLVLCSMAIILSLSTAAMAVNRGEMYCMFQLRPTNSTDGPSLQEMEVKPYWDGIEYTTTIDNVTYRGIYDPQMMNQVILDVIVMDSNGVDSIMVSTPLMALKKLTPQEIFTNENKTMINTQHGTLACALR